MLLSVSILGQNIVFAQGLQQENKIRIGYNDAISKVSFIGADPANPITILSAQAQGLEADSKALLMVQAYAADFGLRNASHELELISIQE